jgi:ribosome-binding protein aMBF1 (putative translation factor)
VTSCDICGDTCAPDTRIEVGGAVLHVCEECAAADERTLELAWKKISLPMKEYLLGVWKNDA